MLIWVTDFTQINHQQGQRASSHPGAPAAPHEGSFLPIRCKPVAEVASPPKVPAAAGPFSALGALGQVRIRLGCRTMLSLAPLRSTVVGAGGPLGGDRGSRGLEKALGRICRLQG